MKKVNLAVVGATGMVAEHLSSAGRKKLAYR